MNKLVLHFATLRYGLLIYKVSGIEKVKKAL